MSSNCDKRAEVEQLDVFTGKVRPPRHEDLLTSESSQVCVCVINIQMFVSCVMC